MDLFCQIFKVTKFLKSKEYLVLTNLVSKISNN